MKLGVPHELWQRRLQLHQMGERRNSLKCSDYTVKLCDMMYSLSKYRPFASLQKSFEIFFCFWNTKNTQKTFIQETVIVWLLMNDDPFWVAEYKVCELHIRVFSQTHDISSIDIRTFLLWWQKILATKCHLTEDLTYEVFCSCSTWF